MPTSPMGRPDVEEFGSYFGRYISLVPADDLVAYMTDQISEVETTLAPVSEARAGQPYAPGKWTIKEVVGHLSDTERVFQYRAMSFARADPNPLPGFDQDLWTPNAEFNASTLERLVKDWTLVRRANLAFIESLPLSAVTRMGRASDNPISVRAACYIAAGHVAHHLRLLREQYFA